MELDRRTFLILPAAAALTGSAPAPAAGEAAAASPQIASGMIAGARRLGIHRVGQRFCVVGYDEWCDDERGGAVARAYRG